MKNQRLLNYSRYILPRVNAYEELIFGECVHVTKCQMIWLSFRVQTLIFVRAPMYRHINVEHFIGNTK